MFQAFLGQLTARPSAQTTRTFAVSAATWCCLLTACASQEQAGLDAMNIVSQGVVNDPANKSLRFDLLRFGLERFCYQMQQRGVAMKLREDQPIAGRFFATSCQSQVIENEDRQTLALRYAGRGYAWTNVTGRVGFEAQGFVEYAPDFRLDGDAMYIYFRPQNVEASTFSTSLVESAATQTGLAVLGVSPDQVGRDVVLGQLRRGFTVIRDGESGSTDFAPGLLALGQRPFHPFRVVASDKRTLDNDRTEVHAGQQDYLGGFEVPDADQALYVTMTLDGAPAVDVLVVPEAQGQQLVARFTAEAGPQTPQVSPFGWLLAPGTASRQAVPVPPGKYYLIIDNSAAVGQAQPGPGPATGPAARVDYLVQVGDRP